MGKQQSWILLPEDYEVAIISLISVVVLCYEQAQ